MIFYKKILKLVKKPYILIIEKDIEKNNCFDRKCSRMCKKLPWGGAN